MPFQAVAWAWKTREVFTPAERCVLLWLANRADERGWVYGADWAELQRWAHLSPIECYITVLLVTDGYLAIWGPDDDVLVRFPIQRDANAEPVRNGEPIPQALKEEILREAGYQCFACRRDDGLHVDHIIPRRRGGTNDWGNLQALCSRCNLVKSDRLGWAQP